MMNKLCSNIPSTPPHPYFHVSNSKYMGILPIIGPANSAVPSWRLPPHTQARGNRYVLVISQPCLASCASVRFMGSGNLSNKSCQSGNMQRVTSRQFFRRSWSSENVRWIASTPLSAVPSVTNIANDKDTFSYPAFVEIFRMLLPKDTPRREVSSLWCSNNFNAFGNPISSNRFGINGQNASTFMEKINTG